MNRDASSFALAIVGTGRARGQIARPAAAQAARAQHHFPVTRRGR